MKENPIAMEDFQEILPRICDKTTSSDPDNWTSDNPLYGHCAVVSALAQFLFDGELLRASLEPYPKFKHMRSHYFNQLLDGTTIDFTAAQFGNEYPKNMQTEPRTREYVLGNKETLERYKILSDRFFEELNKK